MDRVVTPGRWRLVRIAAGVLLLALVLAAMDVPRLWASLVGADARIVVLAIAGLTAMHCVPAVAWRSMIATVSRVQIGWRETLALSYAAQAVGGVTPANLGGDVVRAAAVRTAGHRWTVSVLPILVQRATSYLALALLAIPAVVALTGFAEVGSVIAMILGVTLIAGVAVTWLTVAAPDRLRRFVRQRVDASRVPGSDLSGRAVARLGGIGLVSGLLFHAGSLLLTWWLIAGVAAGSATLAVLGALTMARLSLALPLTPSGVGIQEAVVVTLVAASGGQTEAVLAGVLLARLSLVATTIIGGALLAAGRTTLTSQPSLR